MIVAAAIRWNGLIFTLPKPARHHTILHAMHAAVPTFQGGEEDQGFLTSDGEYVDRERARQIVEEAKQPRNPLGFAHPCELFSEDVW